MSEIDKALKLLNKQKVVLMQCSSIYPCPENLVGLNVIKEMKNKYGNKYQYGFSDHTFGSEAAICSLIYGANFIEKHITFSKKCTVLMPNLQWNLKILSIFVTH